MLMKLRLKRLANVIKELNPVYTHISEIFSGYNHINVTTFAVRKTGVWENGKRKQEREEKRASNLIPWTAVRDWSASKTHFAHCRNASDSHSYSIIIKRNRCSHKGGTLFHLTITNKMWLNSTTKMFSNCANMRPRNRSISVKLFHVC